MPDYKDSTISTKELEPFHDWVIVKRDHEVSETESGLIIPEKYRDKPLACTVIRAGWEVDWLAEGDRILIGRWDGTDMKCNDGSWITLVKPEDIVCRVNASQEV